MTRATKDPGAVKAIKRVDFQALAEFRHQIGRYLNFSDRSARAAGIEPKQYQLLLAIEGLPNDAEPTIGRLAEQLHLRHHSAVELINRAETNNLVKRSRVGTRVLVCLTKQGQRILARAVEERLQELRVAGPVLVKALQQLIETKNTTAKRKRG